jgi:predicted NAD/FAD-binding protein
LFEKNQWMGGHAHTVDVRVEGVSCAIDTGFLVYNERTYPNFVRMLDSLGVSTVGTDMSFSVSVPDGKRKVEWAGTNLNAVFAQRGNLISPRFIRMLADIGRFNSDATWFAEHGASSPETLGEFLERGGYSRALRDWYLLPMAGAIWSCPPQQMLAFPMHTFARFCHNHALLQVNNRPKWRTVSGGARHYVRRIIEMAAPSIRSAAHRVERLTGGGVQITDTDGRSERFDAVVLACHPDEALHMMVDATPEEKAVLGQIKYQPNQAVLHVDATLLPRSRRAWAAWNYVASNEGSPDGSTGRRFSVNVSRVSVNYLINKLQPLPVKTPVVLSLNPIQPIANNSVLGTFEYAHPVLDGSAIEAQKRLHVIQGCRSTWFAGAWTGYGFHEDGLKSGLAAAACVLRALTLQRDLVNV